MADRVDGHLNLVEGRARPAIGEIQNIGIFVIAKGRRIAPYHIGLTSKNKDVHRLRTGKRTDQGQGAG